MNHVNLSNLLAATPDQYTVLGWIVLLPLLGAILNGILGKRVGRQAVYIAGIGSVAASFLLSLVAFAALVKTSHHLPEGAEHVNPTLSFLPEFFGRPWQWIDAPTGPSTFETIHVRYVLDPLSGVMLLVITGIGTLIHIYSAGYMSHDDSYARFFTYLNLFIFAMLNLVLGDSMVLMFLGWEGVGLCSYLLIGFWFTNSLYANAGRKAFIVNRIGDAGFILGMTILAWKGGSYRFEVLHEHISAQGSAHLASLADVTNLGSFLVDAVPGLSSIPALASRLEGLSFSWGGIACFLLFIGCCGKSAQIPLFVWLPDAMAGPTPVSALIHAATMVTAGIYLLCRLSFVFVLYPQVMSIIALVGAATALFAATIAVTQVELKKVLAYSTVSQLGFMFMGCGVGAFSSGLFHVFTHAFFKACLFLGAGAVMHACRDKQDIRELGGLKDRLPVTYWTFAVATLAIIGTPLFSGFFSKDEILFRALTNPFAPRVGMLVYVMGVAAATLTSFYMCRLVILTFWGDGPAYLLAGAGAAVDTTAEATKPEAHDDHDGHDDHDDHGGHGHGHDEPSEDGIDMKLMTYPLVVLALASVFAGLLGIPHLFTHREGYFFVWLEHPVSDVARVAHGSGFYGMNYARELPSMLGGTLAWLIGMGGAYWVYVVEKGKPARDLAVKLPALYDLVVDKWRIDELYSLLIVRPLTAIAEFIKTFDKFIVDGLVNLVGWLAMVSGRVLKLTQTGAIQVYSAAIGLGTLAVVVWAVLLPTATITTRAEANGATVVEASGGPGYRYQFAFFGLNESARSDRLADRCPMAAANTALRGLQGEAARLSSEARKAERIEGPRCIAVLAENAFGRSTVVTSLVVPNAPAAPGNAR